MDPDIVLNSDLCVYGAGDDRPPGVPPGTQEARHLVCWDCATGIQRVAQALAAAHPSAFPAPGCGRVRRRPRDDRGSRARTTGRGHPVRRRGPRHTGQRDPAGGPVQGARGRDAGRAGGGEGGRDRRTPALRGGDGPESDQGAVPGFPGSGLSLPQRGQQGIRLHADQEPRVQAATGSSTDGQPRQPGDLRLRRGEVAGREGGRARDRDLPGLPGRQAPLRGRSRRRRADPGRRHRQGRLSQGQLRARPRDLRPMRGVRRGPARLLHQAGRREVRPARDQSPGLRDGHQGDLEDQAREPHARPHHPHHGLAPRLGHLRRVLGVRHEGQHDLVRLRDRAELREPLHEPPRQHAAPQAASLLQGAPRRGRMHPRRGKDDSVRRGVTPCPSCRPRARC